MEKKWGEELQKQAMPVKAWLVSSKAGFIAKIFLGTTTSAYEVPQPEMSTAVPTEKWKLFNRTFQPFASDWAWENVVLGRSVSQYMEE